MTLAPIVLFAYNRPAHTRRTLEALAATPEAARSALYVFCDGPNPDATAEDRAAIAEVRRVVRERAWCGTVEVRESDANRGLAASIVGGVSDALDRHDRAVVLEDDIVVSKGFLTYMNEALELYRDEPHAFQVSGYMVPPQRTFRRRRDTGFLRVTTSWGWGTWARAWQHYSDDAEALLDQVTAIGREAFDLDGTSFHVEELERNVSGDLRTWAVRWYASVFVRGGLCLYPRRSLVENGGLDGSGTHCHDDSRGVLSGRPARSIRVRAQEIAEDRAYLREFQAFYRSLHRAWTHTRLRDRVALKARRLAVAVSQGTSARHP